MTEFNTSLPSIRRIQNAIKEKEEVEIKLLTGDEFKGTVKWVDNHCLCIDGAQSGQPHTIMIWNHAIAFMKSRT